MKNKKLLSVILGIALTGVLCSFTINTQEDKKCPTCNGSGSIIKTVDCSNCKGKGQVQSGQNWVTCGPCNGNGKIKIEQCCITCSGKGMVENSNNGTEKNNLPYPKKCE